METSPICRPNVTELKQARHGLPIRRPRPPEGRIVGVFMSRKRSRMTWLIGVAGAALALSTGAASAQSADEPIATGEPVTAEEIVVPGQITYRNRSEETAPVLEYGLDYFQRFEPLTVGDMLKRVPSAAFVSDVLEYDGVQLRGLDPGYTQVLINGERVPGSGVDRSFFVDRIPAELVERVEIVRNTSANRSGDALAGALNIVLRDSLSLDGGYIRGGALFFEDDEIEGTLGAVYGGTIGEARYLIGANYQGRHNPKNKVSYRYDEPGGDFDNREDQSDVRDGEDYSLNGSLTFPIGNGGELSFSGVAVHTERSEIETSFEYEDLTSTDDAFLTTEVPGFTFIEQTNISVDMDFEHPFMGGELELDLGYARFEDVTSEGETETAYDIDSGPLVFEEFSAEAIDSDIIDQEFSGTIGWTGRYQDARLEIGVDFVNKEREGNIGVREAECEAGDPGCAPGDPNFPPDFEDAGPTDGGLYTIDERRIDPFVMLSAERGPIEWEVGLRYETTEFEAIDRDTGETASSTYEILLPSAHVLFNLSEQDRLRFSVGRTVRRPNFNFVTPAVFEGEYEDNDFLGNPQLNPESAWGVDIGFERRLGRQGVIGVNVFYRDVRDLIELVNTGELTDDYLDDLEDFLDENPGSTEQDFFDEEAPVFVYTAENIGDGTVWGIEFDLSTPLTFVGLPNTGVFLNYSWMDSEVTDFAGERRFNNQPDYVFNIGFIHDLPSLDMAFGATYREQGDAFSRILAEEVTTSYTGDLEIFIERRFGDNFVLRFTGQNLLDAEKNEIFDKFATEADQLARDYDEYELESENSGPVFQIVGRYAF